MGRKILYDVLLIRILLIFLLVVYHSFAIYNGAWKPLNGFPIIESYRWIADISYSFMLEMFVFISGLILGFQALNKTNEFIKDISFIKKKAQRLLVPSIVFGTLYVLIFSNGFNLQSVYEILNGIGHMWFLPMLFLCFCYISIISRYKYSAQLLLFFCFIIALQPIPQLPFQLTKSLYYFFFFLFGYLIGCRKIAINRYIKWRYFVFLFILYLTTSVLFHMWKYEILSGEAILQKLLYFYVKRFNTILCALSGLFAVYIAINIRLSHGNFVLSEKYIKFSGYCFGIYLIQQFILKLLYNNTMYVSFCGPYMLPIISFVITFVLSVVIVGLLMKTKIGRILIA